MRELLWPRAFQCLDMWRWSNRVELEELAAWHGLMADAWRFAGFVWVLGVPFLLGSIWLGPWLLIPAGFTLGRGGYLIWFLLGQERKHGKLVKHWETKWDRLIRDKANEIVERVKCK